MNKFDEAELNAFVTEEHYLSTGISARILVEYDIHQRRPQLVIVVNDDTAKQHVIDAWDEIQFYLKRLVKIIGSDLNINYDNVLLNVHQMHERGLGYGEIAKILNYRSLALICCAYYSGESLDDNKWGLGITSLYFLFIGLRLKGEQFEQQIHVAYEHLNKKIIPWKLEDGPFDRRRVRDNVDYFLDRVQKGQISLRTADKPVSSDLLVDASLLKNGWYKKANELLSKNTDYWKSRQEWITKRLDTVKKELSNSESPILEEYRNWLKEGGNL
jgi:hypothetical protein